MPQPSTVAVRQLQTRRLLRLTYPDIHSHLDKDLWLILQPIHSLSRDLQFAWLESHQAFLILTKVVDDLQDRFRVVPELGQILREDILV